jgi:hypothetical protein
VQNKVLEGACGDAWLLVQTLHEIRQLHERHGFVMLHLAQVGMRREEDLNVTAPSRRIFAQYFVGASRPCTTFEQQPIAIEIKTWGIEFSHSDRGD